MSWLLLVASLIAPPVTAGQMSNPLRVYGTDNHEYTITFTAEGVEFEGRLFEPLGRNRFRFATTAEGCDDHAPRQVESELRVLATTVEERTTETFVTCGNRARSTSRYIRRFGMRSPGADGPCRANPMRLQQGAATLTLHPLCDGTATLELDGLPPLRLSEKRPGAFEGKRGPIAASVALQADGGAKVQVRGGGKSLRGLWTAAP